MWRLKQFFKRIALAIQSKRASRRTKKIEQQWAVFAKSLPRGANGKVMLHIGCGDVNAEGFINLDARPRPHVHIVTTNLFRLRMIPDGVVDLIYMSHVLEHVSHRDVVATLSEMRRILKKGGVLRISVPDFDKIIDIYEANDHDIAAVEGPLMGGQDYPFNYHCAAFNESHLRKCILRSGFTEAMAWDPKNCEHHDFDDWASSNITWGGREFPISLNIEAFN